MTQSAADAIGVPLAAVTFHLGDTNYPETPVSGGSQTAATAGSAVFLAAKALREKLVQLAMAHPTASDAKSEDLILEKDHIKWRGGDRAVRLQDLFAPTGQSRLDAEASAKHDEEAKRYSSYSFGAQFAEVRVDADLGQIQVSRMVGAFGAGKILNAKTARSQFMGGMVWGIRAGALRRKRSMTNGSAALSTTISPNVPFHSNADVGNIEVLWTEEDDQQVSPIGAKGIGEIGITGAAAAITPAPNHATGKRVRDVPITPDKLL